MTLREYACGPSRLPWYFWRFHLELKTYGQRPQQDLEVWRDDADCAASVRGSAPIRLRPKLHPGHYDAHQARHRHHRRKPHLRPRLRHLQAQGRREDLEPPLQRHRKGRRQARTQLLPLRPVLRARQHRQRNRRLLQQPPVQEHLQHAPTCARRRSANRQ